MDLNSIPLFAMLKDKLSYTGQRQKLIAENVANADVPGYAPRDMKSFSFAASLQAVQRGQGAGALTPVSSHSGHMDLGAPSLPSAMGAGDVAAPDSETRLDGNRVVLEEQMVKLTEARMDYDAAVGFYQQSLGLLKTAIRKPGEA